MRYLIDTNVWIDALAGIQGPICHSRNLLAGIQEKQKHGCPTGNFGHDKIVWIPALVTFRLLGYPRTVRKAARSGTAPYSLGASERLQAAPYSPAQKSFPNFQSSHASVSISDRPGKNYKRLDIGTQGRIKTD